MTTDDIALILMAEETLLILEGKDRKQLLGKYPTQEKYYTEILNRYNKFKQFKDQCSHSQSK